MQLTDWLILLLSIALLLYALWEVVVMPRLHGATLLAVAIQRRNRLDSLIFIGLLAILLWQHLQVEGKQLTTLLLLSQMALVFWFFWLRTPRIFFKAQGFFFGAVYIPYQRIRAINLSEDGVLVIALEKRRVLIYVTRLDDLETIYRFMLEQH